MIYATGTKSRGINGNIYKMHAPNFPYDSITYVGYTKKSMMKKYRERYNLKRKHITWIICGED